MNFLVNSVLWIAYTVSLYFSVFLFLVYIDKKSIFKTEKSSVDCPQKPFVSILIPAFNEEATIIKTLESVNSLNYPRDKYEVFVINDGSQDGTEEKVLTYIHDKPHFRLISHQNKGKAASLNIALEQAQGEFFTCLDADSFVEKQTLRKMLSLYYRENDASLAIITPAMKVSQPKNILQKVQWLEYVVIILIGRLASQLDSLYVAPGPFSLYRTDIIKKLGGFDEHNITEDQEIAYRVQKHHYKIKQCFDGYVYTTAPKRLKPFYWQRRRWYMGSITCLHKYKDMVANKKYGDFGMIQMVKNIAGYILAFTGITVALYLIILPLFSRLKNIFVIKFNLLPYLTNLQFTFTPLDLFLTDFRKGFIFLSLVFLGFLFFYLAHKNANEKMMKLGFIPLIPYFLFYYILKGVILLLSLFQFARSKKVRW